MEKFILSVDQGTTGTTVLVFGHDGRVRGPSVQRVSANLSATRLGRA